MSVTAADLRILQSVKHRQRRDSNRIFESTLIPELDDNHTLLGVFSQLRAMSLPKDVSPSRRQVSQDVGPLEVKFYAKKVEDFVNEYGEVDHDKSLLTARTFRFDGQTTVTRQVHVGGNFYYCLTGGGRSLTIEERGTKKTGYTHTIMRVLGFVEPSGRAVGYRSPGRGPRFESE